MKWPLVNPAVVFLASLFSLFLLPAEARGYLSANMELDLGNSRTTSQSALSEPRISTSDNFLQRYFLNGRQEIFPTISVGVGYVLEKDLEKSLTNDIESRTTLVRMSPSATISFANPFFGAAAGYNEVESKTETSGGPAQILVWDNFTASLGLKRRENMPTAALEYTRSHYFDREHLVTDFVTEQIQFASIYRPLKQLEVRYTGSRTNTVNRLDQFETTDLTHSGRLTYNDSFFKNRMQLYSVYDLSLDQLQSRFPAAGTGEVSRQITPVAGLSGAGPLGSDNPPEVPALDTLVSNSVLIDGSTSAPSGVNIGFSSLATAPRNMGLDLGVETDVNSVYVWVNQRLPASISNSFTWDVYISSDTTSLKQWTLWQTVAPASFGAFDNRFELRFTSAKTRFIKVVTSPLASPVPVPGVDVSNILVTEVQAFIFTPVQNLQKERNSTGQRIESGMRAKIADVPNVYYNVYYTQTKSSGQNLSPYLLVNSLSLNQRLSRVFTTNAQTSRTDTHESDGSHLIYDYSASLTATPLATLNHTLRVTRETEEFGDKRKSSNFVYFNNGLKPYHGISLNLSAVEGNARSETGERSRSTILTAGSTIAPHRTMTINLYYTDLTSRTTISSQATESDTRTSTASVAYRPYDTLYLYAAYSTSRTSRSDATGGPETRTQNYVMTWSPILSGALWITVSATQQLTSSNNGETDTITPLIHWAFIPNAVIESSYQLYTMRSIGLKTKTETFFTTLRVSL